MAIDDPEDDKEEGEVEKPKKKGKLLKIIVIVFSILLLLGGAIGATLYFTGALTGDHSTAADESADAKDKGKSSKKKSKKEAPIYFAFDPPFVVNFVENNQIRYLQITMEVMTREEEVVENLKTHMPVIRNNLILVFSNQTYDTISTSEGKLKLRDEALAEIQQVLKNETGKTGVEAVYFTSFVMQ